MKLIDKDKLLKMFEEAEVTENDDGNQIKLVYLGNILDLTPSGKFYTPWANSNVDPCPHCKGTTEVRNEHAKTKKFRGVSKKFDRLFQQNSTKYGHPIDWPQRDNERRIKYLKQMEWWGSTKSCPECAGLGSLEARLDQDWWTQLEADLEEIGAWHQGSEGDGLDVLVGIGVDENEDT